jgi:hypothetical protein
MTRILGTVLALCCLLAVGATPSSAAAVPAAEPTDLPAFTQVQAPSVSGVRRYGHRLVVSPGRWSPTPATTRYQWYRDGQPLAGATSRVRDILPGDVGHRLAVRVTVTHPTRTTASPVVQLGVVKHRVDTRRVVRYSVRTKGRVPASVATFKTLAQQTYDDPRGWRGRGVKFVRVASGGAFTLWLSEAGRVGRNVIINVQRWKYASPAWNRAGRSLRDYRHMVVNHETGHWLGRGHASCPRPGALAPVMQQSKGTQGCRLNPWPTLAELRR